MIERSSGILLPVFSLPSRYGIGSLGKEAREFVEFLHRGGQRWWQILPIGPAGAGNSPYTSESTFAGNPLFLDLPLLAEDGLLTAEELAGAAEEPTARIDYAALYRTREPLLRRAFAVGYPRDRAAVEAFSRQAPWVGEYALYRAAKARFGDRAWLDWPDEALRRHEDGAVERYRAELAEDVAYHTYLQYLFWRQWQALKGYAEALDIKILGDMPIYVSLDSADVWSERRFFLLGEDGRPTKVAGVPPDYFSADGQLWGNPLYDWPALRRDGFGWWIRRVEGAADRFHAVRMDHFRAFERYWAVPARAATAKTGAWEPGPGMDLLGVLTGWFPNVTYIAEDLGLLTPEVHALRRAAGLPGMRVLEFAFSGPDNAYLPHNYEPDTVCYTGTHDNDTAVGWYRGASESQRAFAQTYLGVSGPQAVCRALLRTGCASVAKLFVAQMQDWLELDGEARINTPGVAEGNWRWRLVPGRLTDDLARRIRACTWACGRCPSQGEENTD